MSAASNNSTSSLFDLGTRSAPTRRTGGDAPWALPRAADLVPIYDAADLPDGAHHCINVSECDGATIVRGEPERWLLGPAIALGGRSRTWQAAHGVCGLYLRDNGPSEDRHL